ncbi:MAG: ATP-binding protein [Planctomycetota bacterium]
MSESLRDLPLDSSVAQSALDSSSAIQDRFLAMLSHELRTPLTPALISISQLQHVIHNEFNNDPRLVKPLSVARKSIETEVRMIEDLLDLLNLNRGKLSINRNPFDIVETVRSVAEVFEPQAERKGVAVTIDMPDEAVMIDGDRARIEQVLWNVIDNAVKFTNAGNIRIVAKPTADGTVQVSVIDTGMGISAEALPRVFFAFEQGGRGADSDADEADDRYARTRIDGLGMGLALSKSIIDLHGGRLIARSAGIGKGSTFTVELDTTGARHHSAGDRPPLDAAGPGHSILLVDDHVDTAAAMGRLLRRFGHEVTTVGTVAEAVEAVEHNAFDILISDIGLPDGTGHDLIRRMPEPLRQRSIAVSGFGSDGDKRQSAAAGFREHLVKPITLDALNAAVDRARGKVPSETEADS